LTDQLVVRGVRVAVEITSGLTPAGDLELEQLAPASEQAPSVKTTAIHLRLFTNIPDLRVHSIVWGL
jgi:hypothetical protein